MPGYKPLPNTFFNRSAVIVAEELIGTYLMRRVEGHTTAFMITETEAYEGLDDKASHAYRERGKTARNIVMFGRSGTIYVYFTYGMHWMLNIVCGPNDHPAAVLIRGVQGISGPARLTKQLHIDKTLNGKLLGKASGLWVASSSSISSTETDFNQTKSARKNKFKIIKTPRIGISYAGPVWSKKLYRFVLESGAKKKKEKGL